MPRLAQMLGGWRKEDPPTKKKIPVGVDIPEFLAQLGRDKDATELVKAVVDLTLIAFYYLFRVGEYTIKGSRNNTKNSIVRIGRHHVFLQGQARALETIAY